ncbi:MAG: hypothetical protein IJX78_07140 [Bacilli bacterium]|nr:hypothetical protein [Bacilli bacterium]
MKTNKMLRISAILLVLTLLSTCVISGTFAKYVTKGEASDTATVAKWGIELTVAGEDVLYDDDKIANDVAAKVSASNLAAPGTYQKLANVKLSGTPEVSYNIQVDVDLKLENWTVNGNDYCPLEFTVGSTVIKIDGSTIKTVDELEAAVEKAIMAAITGGDGTVNNKTYDATQPTPGSAGDLDIVWKWAFDNGAEADKNDTALGNAATRATINFSLTVTVTQVD